MSKKRDFIPYKFNNEIIGEKEEVLNTRQWCNKRLYRIFRRGRVLKCQELNVTRIVGAIRTSHVVNEKLSEHFPIGKSLKNAAKRRIFRDKETEMKFKAPKLSEVLHPVSTHDTHVNPDKTDPFDHADTERNPAVSPKANPVVSPKAIRP